MERRPLTLGLALAALLLLALGAAAWIRTRGEGRGASAGSTLAELARLAPAARAPDGTRIRVQVLNATRTRGLARRATHLLRDRGFDVVEVGTAREALDSTLVLDRSGHADWAALVGRVMEARVERRPDSSRYLDVTVLIGRSWRPPAEPFYP